MGRELSESSPVIRRGVTMKNFYYLNKKIKMKCIFISDRMLRLLRDC